MSGLARRETTRERTLRELHQLIAALDRRVPRIEQPGKVAMASASSELRAAVVRRIDVLEREIAGDANSTPSTSRRGIDDAPFGGGDPHARMADAGQKTRARP